MKLKFLRDELVPVLSKIGGVVEKRQTLPILGNVLVEVSGGEAAFTVTDLEVEIRVKLPVEESDSGSFTVSARKFGDICRSLPEGSEIFITVDKEKALIRSGRNRFSVGVLPAEDFPRMDLGGIVKEITVKSGVLKTLVDKTAFAMAQQDVRYYLNGMLIDVDSEGIRAVATDGHRLATWVEKAEVRDLGPFQILVPRKAVVEISRILGSGDEEVLLDVGGSFARVRQEDLVFSTKLIDGKFPEYQRVIPRALERVAIVDRLEMKQALGRAAILSSEKYKGIRLGFEKGLLRMTAHNPEKEEAEGEIELEYDGDSVAVGFNVAYLIDVLNVMDSEKVVIEFGDSGSSAVMKEEGKAEGIFVIMPMRL